MNKYIDIEDAPVKSDFSYNISYNPSFESFAYEYYLKDWKIENKLKFVKNYNKNI